MWPHPNLSVSICIPKHGDARGGWRANTFDATYRKFDNSIYRNFNIERSIFRYIRTFDTIYRKFDISKLSIGCPSLIIGYDDAHTLARISKLVFSTTRLRMGLLCQPNLGAYYSVGWRNIDGRRRDERNWVLNSSRDSKMQGTYAVVGRDERRTYYRHALCDPGSELRLCRREQDKKGRRS